MAKRGGIAIDKSSTWRMDPRVPLVVPEINPSRVADHQGIISCPNCTTIPLVMALEPLRRRAGLKSAVVTTFQSVSGAGLPGIEELEAQQAARSAREPLPPPKAFPAQIANNVIPICETLVDDYTSEEHKLLDESRKILELPSFEVSMTCVRVPVPVGHSASVLVETERPLSVDEAIEALRAFPGIEVFPNGPHPTTGRCRGPRRGSGRADSPRPALGSALAVGGGRQPAQGRRHQRGADRRRAGAPWVGGPGPRASRRRLTFVASSRYSELTLEAASRAAAGSRSSCERDARRWSTRWRSSSGSR